MSMYWVVSTSAKGLGIIGVFHSGNKRRIACAHSYRMLSVNVTIQMCIPEINDIFVIHYDFFKYLILLLMTK